MGHDSFAYHRLLSTHTTSNTSVDTKRASTRELKLIDGQSYLSSSLIYRHSTNLMRSLQSFDCIFVSKMLKR